MNREDLREYLEREPFQPFRLHLSSGAFFDIRQPQLAYVSRSTLTVGQSVETDQQRFVVIALVHIVWLEILLPAP
jgi:hypothetical protein